MTCPEDIKYEPKFFECVCLCLRVACVGVCMHALSSMWSRGQRQVSSSLNLELTDEFHGSTSKPQESTWLCFFIPGFIIRCYHGTWLSHGWWGAKLGP